MYFFKKQLIQLYSVTDETDTTLHAKTSDIVSYVLEYLLYHGEATEYADYAADLENRGVKHDIHRKINEGKIAPPPESVKQYVYDPGFWVTTHSWYAAPVRIGIDVKGSIDSDYLDEAHSAMTQLEDEFERRVDR